jgi:hypothetical protein
MLVRTSIRGLAAMILLAFALAPKAGTPINQIRIDIETDGVIYVASSRSDGSYTRDEVPAGTYRVCTGGITTGSIPQCFDHIDQPPGAEGDYVPLVLAEGESRSGIDFDLSRGGSISGRLVDAFSGAPLRDSDATLWIYDAALQPLGPAYAHTDTDGNYRFDGVPAGSWYVFVHIFEPFGDTQQIWPDVPCDADSCDVAAGTAIEVPENGSAENVDFAFHPDVLIRGRVTDAETGEGVSGVTVNSYFFHDFPPGGPAYVATSTQSGPDGSYVLYGYANDPFEETQYYVGTRNGAPYIDVAWPDTPFIDSHDIAQAESFTFAHGDQLADIDLALPTGGAMRGVVSSASTGAPLDDAVITLFASDSRPLWTGRTASDGSYATPAWYAGTYYIEANWLWSPSACAVYSGRPCPADDESLFSVDPTPLRLDAGEIRSVGFTLDTDTIYRDSFDVAF